MESTMEAMAVTPDQMDIYRATARRRLEDQRRRLGGWRERAWAAARRAAALLRSDFGATRVLVFGSLTNEGSFTRWSDVDIAAWGIRKEDTLRAIGATMAVDAEIQVNLVDANACRPLLLESIESEGIAL